MRFIWIRQAKQWSLWLLVRKQYAYLITLCVASSYHAPLHPQQDSRPWFCGRVVGLGMLVHQFPPVPFQSANKLLLDVGYEGVWVTIHHVITIQALSMSDPDPSQGNALHEQPPPGWLFAFTA